MKRCLNIGCGDKPCISFPEFAWTNLDIIPRPLCQVVRDVRRGLPFQDGSFEFVYMDNVLEHFSSEDAVFLINEVDRVLVEGGEAEIIVPHAHSQGAFQDPTHRSFWVPRSVIYWCQGRSKYGGRFVGITAHLVEMSTEIFGNMDTEAFIRFKVQKLQCRGEQNA